MAIEIYHTLKSDSKKMWRESGARLRGSHTTFMAGLKHIEKKYLPSVEYDHPFLWASREKGEYCSRMTLAAGLFIDSDETLRETIDELWALETDPRLSKNDRIFFASFMDKAIFRAEDARLVTDAWKSVSDEMHEASKKDFHALADAVMELVKNDDISCIGINWNSVNSFHELYGEDDRDCYDFVKYMKEWM